MLGAQPLVIIIVKHGRNLADFYVLYATKHYLIQSLEKANIELYHDLKMKHLLKSINKLIKCIKQDFQQPI